MVLHDITNDAELVKVTAPAFGAERLFEVDLHRGDVVAIPGRIENAIAESETNRI